MNDIPDALRVYRDQLRDAVADDLSRRRRVPAVTRRSLRLGVPALLAAGAATAAALVLATGSQTPSANAALLHRVAAALTPPAGTILHEQAEITIPGQAAQPFELWAQADSPHAYRVVKWGHEGSWNGSSFSSYDAGSNTVTTVTEAGPSHDPTDPAATLRSLVQSGQAVVEGTTTLDGVRAYKLTVDASPDPFLVGTAYVATSDYRPLEIDTVTNSEKIVYRTYEYLPATGGNLALLDVAASHPGAAAVTAPAPATTTSS
jgi:hypothetical protein